MENETESEKKGTFGEFIKRQNAGLWFGILFLAYAVLYFKMSLDIPYQSKLGAGPGMYPRWLAGFSILIALIYIVQSCTHQVFSMGRSFPGKTELFNVFTVFLACMIFLFLLEVVGFNIAGSLLLFYFTMVIYGLSLVGFGLLISSLCATQQQAFIGVFVFMMPAILLSGYVSPVENMPVWLQHLTWINPIRHFTDITKQIYLKDASLSIIWGSLWPLLFIAATTGSVAYAMFRRKIA